MTIEELNSILEENLIDQEGPDALRSILFRPPSHWVPGGGAMQGVDVFWRELCEQAANGPRIRRSWRYLSRKSIACYMRRILV